MVVLLTGQLSLLAWFDAAEARSPVGMEMGGEQM